MKEEKIFVSHLAKQCLENEKMKDMFPLNYKSNIQVRNREKNLASEDTTLPSLC